MTNKIGDEISRKCASISCETLVTKNSGNGSLATWCKHCKVKIKAQKYRDRKRAKALKQIELATPEAAKFMISLGCCPTCGKNW